MTPETSSSTAVDWEDLSDFLMSDRAPDTCMRPAEVDGYLTGIAVSITVALLNLVVSMGTRSSLDRRFVPFREPNSHRTRTEHVQNEEYFSVRREPATVMLGDAQE